MRRTMRIHFEGFWQCRMSTDPDPTLEGRGTSGYTIALPREGDFDRVIRTQPDQIPVSEFRRPFPPYMATLPDGSPRPFGVTVTKVESAPDPATDLLLEGAELRLMQNPRFELRNQIVGDGVNRIAPPIVPFDVQIGRKDEVFLRRSDPLDPARPHLEIWQLAPADFAPRVPVTYRHLSDEVVETIFSQAAPSAGDANSLFTGYFNQRKQLLSMWLSEPGLDPLVAAGYRARVRVLDDFTSPNGGADPGLIENRLGLQCIWDHPIRGKDAFVGEQLARFVDKDRDWHTRFWMGGWDGDLLLGWTEGRIDLPIHS
jgi:hypothetical protein